MSIKVTLNQLLGSQEQMNRLMQEKLPVKAAYRLQKLVKQIAGELEAFQKAHVELIKQHGGIEEGEGNFRVPAEKLPEFVPEFETLIGEVVELQYLPLTPEDLGRAEMSGADLAALSWLFAEENGSAHEL